MNLGKQGCSPAPPVAYSAILPSGYIYLRGCLAIDTLAGGGGIGGDRRHPAAADSNEFRTYAGVGWPSWVHGARRRIQAGEQGRPTTVNQLLVMLGNCNLCFILSKITLEKDYRCTSTNQ